LRNFAIEVDETWAFEDLLYRFLVMIMERPDARLAKTEIVREERLFFAVATLLQKLANGVKKTAQ
jgi:hypothetical protein